ncbi:uncharacterized protein LOC128899983 [Dryobates pubescens]|uniref:uncharacterized protein LOC128899983 n=1 Tax=Dryobates pubescens TaxID=118200 RepID=UPI0023B94305|nr:uncharacterized protein LOC128899983 [Dryobates pubescens]
MKYCTDCLSRSSSSHNNFKGNDNIRNVEKSCSCHSKPGEWFPKGSSAVLTPEAVPVESIEICECLTDTEADSQEETSDQLPVFAPCESSADAFREHNDAIARMFSDLLAGDNGVQDKDPDFTRGENKTFEKLESGNASQQSPKESTAQHQQPSGISHAVSLFTEASQENYSCSTASKNSEQSEESFESGYRSSSINSASLDARSLQCTVHQSLFPCSSGSQHDSCVLVQESPNKPSCGTREDGVSSLAHKSFDTLMFPSMGLCSSAYKSCDTLISPSVEPCGSAYRSFDVLVSAFKEPTSSAYKSFDTLLSQSVANSSLAQCSESMCSSLPLAQISETPELNCRDPIYQPPSSGTCHTSCRELGFQNSSSEQTDFPSIFTPANDSAAAFLTEEEIHKQVTYQNVQKKATIIPCPAGTLPSGYQPFDNAVKCNGTFCDHAREGNSGSPYKPFIHLLYSNLRQAPPDTISYTPDQRTDDPTCLVVQHFDCSIAPCLASSEGIIPTSDGSLWTISSDKLPARRKDENTDREEWLLCLLEQNCQDFNSRGRTTKGTKPNSFNSAGQGVQERSSNGPNADFHCHTYKHLRELGKAGQNREVMQHAAGRKHGSVAALPEESLDSTGLNLERKTAEPLELLVSDESPPPPFVDNCPDSPTIHSEGSQPAPAVKKRPVELLRENIQNGKEMESVQGLAQEDNCYMKVA